MFGSSFARNKQTVDSDVDLLVTSDPSKPIHMMHIVELQMELESIPNREVQIICDDSITEHRIRESMLRDSIQTEL